jgi:hypothetical protein
MFHPFCLAEAFRETSTCVVCGTGLHPDRWLSWDLGPLTLELEARATALGTADVRAAMKKSLKCGLSMDTESPSGVFIVFKLLYMVCLQVRSVYLSVIKLREY